MITLKQDVKIVEKLIKLKDEKQLRKFIIPFQPEYRLTIYLKLNPFDQSDWNNLLN